jgi:hypothetical protein
MGDPCDDRIESFSGHMAQVQSCDCTSANEKSPWRRLLSYMCSFICLPFLKHLCVTAAKLLGGGINVL